MDYCHVLYILLLGYRWDFERLTNDIIASTLDNFFHSRCLLYHLRCESDWPHAN